VREEFGRGFLTPCKLTLCRSVRRTLCHVRVASVLFGEPITRTEGPFSIRSREAPLSVAKTETRAVFTTRRRNAPPYTAGSQKRIATALRRRFILAPASLVPSPSSGFLPVRERGHFFCWTNCPWSLLLRNLMLRAHAETDGKAAPRARKNRAGPADTPLLKERVVPHPRQMGSARMSWLITVPYVAQSPWVAAFAPHGLLRTTARQPRPARFSQEWPVFCLASPRLDARSPRP